MASAGNRRELSAPGQAPTRAWTDASVPKWTIAPEDEEYTPQPPEDIRSCQSYPPALGPSDPSAHFCHNPYALDVPVEDSHRAPRTPASPGPSPSHHGSINSNSNSGSVAAAATTTASGLVVPGSSLSQRRAAAAAAAA
eukprot:RCo045170